MTQCTDSNPSDKSDLAPIQRVMFGKDADRREVVLERSKIELTTDAGMLLIGQSDQRCGLLRRLAGCIGDARQPAKVRHEVQEMLAQRVVAINAGYEDINDHGTLRQDLLLQHTIGKAGTELAGAATLSRFENRTGRQELLRMQMALLDHFLDSVGKAPNHLVLDVDSSDLTLHGDQVGRHFNRYYKSYCYTPLYITCGGFLLTGWLCRADNSVKRAATRWLSRVIRHIQERWPRTRIVVRADCAFGVPPMLDLCDELKVDYAIGMTSNLRLLKLSEHWRDAAKRKADRGEPVARAYGSFMYKTKESWLQPRRVVVRAEYAKHGDNPRYVVTSLKGDAQALYDKLYCGRGEMENRIKENKVHMFGDRMSCHHFLPNQFRFTLSAAAYLLHHELRRTACIGTELERAEAATLRSRVLKFGGHVTMSARRFVVSLSHSNPMGVMMMRIASNLALLAKQATSEGAKKLWKKIAKADRRDITCGALRIAKSDTLTCTTAGP